MIELLITLLLLAVIVYVVQLVIGMLNLPEQVKTIAYIIVALIALFYLLDKFGIYRVNI